MQIKLVGDKDCILDGLRLIEDDLFLKIRDTGFTVCAVSRVGGIEVDIQKEKATIYYDKPCHFYRGLMLMVKQLKYHGGQAIRICEQPRIKRVGLMLDVSRNAVLTVDSIKHFLRKMALMGMDLLMLYMEDTYFLEGYDRFGYMRGRYTNKELKEIDDYAFLLGIEVMPYVQTLAHMGQILKWDDTADIRDTGEIILVGEEKTYRFIDHMIGTISSQFRSNRINIGMDEAHNLGLGEYLKLNGYRDRMSIYQEHLSRVIEIIEKYGLRAMISSDMLFRNTGGAADYYEMGDEVECAVELNENIDLMYWDYFRTDSEEIREFIQRHKSWGKKPTFLGTVRTWISYAPGYSQSFANSHAALNACAEEGIEEVVISVWLHDSPENSHFASLPGISYFAQQVYNYQASNSELRECFLIQTGADFDSFLLLEKLDAIALPDGRSPEGNPSKFLLWQDVLLGFFDIHIDGLNAGMHYQQLSAAIEKAVPMMGSGPYSLLMVCMRSLCSVLAIKAEIGIDIKSAYDKDDVASLKIIADDVLPRLSDAVERLRVAHRDLWMSTLKPFGWEILDARYGGLRARFETSAKRLHDYTNGTLSSILELGEVRTQYRTDDAILPVMVCYDQIVSSGYQNGPLR